MSEAAFAFMLAAICASLALALEYIPKPIRAEPPPVAWCVVANERTWITPDTWVERDGWGGMIPAYPCKMLKKEQDV